MKIYLAARYSRHPEMQLHAETLRLRGHEITSRWIEGDHSLDDSLERNHPDEERKRFAWEDYNDLLEADMIISFTEEPGGISADGRPSKGGRHVEFGMGYALHKDMVIIGPREHVFHWLSSVRQYGSLEEALELMEELL